MRGYKNSTVGGVTVMSSGGSGSTDNKGHFSTQIVINPNFTTAADSWTVEVINPGSASSGQFSFSVIHIDFTPIISSVSPNPVIGGAQYIALRFPEALLMSV